jgi:signal transduction histidine kinase
MTTLSQFSTGMSQALSLPLGEIRSVARRQREAGFFPPPADRPRQRHITSLDGARLLVGVMVMRIEGAATRAAAVTADIERLSRLQHGAQLYFDADFVLPADFTGAVAEILAALADPARRVRVLDWIGRIGLARGAGRMAGWIEVRARDVGQWEDFDFAASPEDLAAIIDAAPMVRRIEVRLRALLPLADLIH